MNQKKRNNFLMQSPHLTLYFPLKLSILSVIIRFTGLVILLISYYLIINFSFLDYRIDSNLEICTLILILFLKIHSINSINHLERLNDPIFSLTTVRRNLSLIIKNLFHKFFKKR